MADQNPSGPSNKRPGNIPPPPEDPSGKKKNKFSIYWVYGLILMSLIIYQIMKTASSGGVELMNRQAFTEILKQGDILQDVKATDKEKTGLVVVRNKNIARVFLSKDSVAKKSAFYKTFLSEQDYEALAKSTAPQVYFNIAKDEVFAKQLDDTYTKDPSIKQVQPNYSEEGEVFSDMLKTLLPILLIGLLFIMMMRKVSGPAGGGGTRRHFQYRKIKSYPFR